jgi:hypothetical protein
MKNALIPGTPILALDLGTCLLSWLSPKKKLHRFFFNVNWPKVENYEAAFRKNTKSQFYIKNDAA